MLYIHGQDDQLVSVDLARPVVEQVSGRHGEVHVLADTRHEVLNEAGKAETIAMVANFVQRVPVG